MNSPFADFLLPEINSERFNKGEDEILKASPLLNTTEFDLRDFEVANDFEINRYQEGEDVESEDEDYVNEYQHEEEAHSENYVDIDLFTTEDKLRKWRNRYVPLMDSQKNKNKNELTNLIFYDLHPELNNRKLLKSDSESLTQEWKDIYNQIVLPYLLLRSGLPSNIPLGVKRQRLGMSPDSVHYLALEGGGGRGSVYLGAILALEEQGILPVTRDKTRNKILGLSGASAGSITSFLLSLGYKAKQIQEEFFPISQPSVFASFIDDIEPGFFRTVTAGYKGSQRNRQHNNEIINNFTDADLKPLKKHLETILGGKKYKIIEGLLEVKKWKFDNDYELPSLVISLLNDKIIELLSQGMIGSKLSTLNDKLYQTTGIPSIYNLLHDGGYFTGFGVRKVLRDCLKKYFDKNNIPNYDPDINFKDFYKLTNIDLKVTGTNITEGFGAYFSNQTTPKFPVVEAVGISGCFPFAFKPIMVYSTDTIEDGIEIYDERITATKKKTLYGLWADGGIANNLPLHAFDGKDGALNKNVLALRLTPPKKRISLSQMTQITFEQNRTIDYYSSLLSMLTSPSEESQVRSEAEGRQIIDLDTGFLETTDFDPNPVKVLFYGSVAYNKVKSYFGGN